MARLAVCLAILISLAAASDAFARAGSIHGVSHHASYPVHHPAAAAAPHSDDCTMRRPAPPCPGLVGPR
jgi:hypothetical protein